MVEIVAEISGNHGGDILRAMELIRTAAAAGCHYAKFQYYRMEDMPDRSEGNNAAMYEKHEVPDDWLPRLFHVAHGAGIGLFASVFSVRAAKELLKYDVPYIKIASPESTRLPFETYKAIAAMCPPSNRLIVSSGRRDWEDMRTLSRRMMYCPLGHPPEVTGNDLGFAWTAWGYSDHTTGISTPLAVLESPHIKMIEKHLRLGDRDIDAKFSATATTMELLCKLARNT